MVKKLKSILFNLFNKIAGALAKTGLHKKLPVLAPVHDFLFWKFSPNKETIEIQGSKMHINLREKDPGMLRTFQAYAGKLVHEEATTNLFKKVVKGGDIVVDLGANIGYFSLLAAGLVGPSGKVFSFEPEPRNFNYLIKNIELNNYKNVTPLQKAVSDKNGKTQLFICSYDTGHHTINQYGGITAYSRGRPVEKKSIEIETVTLDSFLKDKTNYRVNVAKIDVEGAEFLAIKGMKNILRENKDIKILLEFFPLLLKQMGSLPEELIGLLQEEYQFNIFAVGHDYAMGSSSQDLVKLNNFREIMGLLKEESDHLNLYLRRQ